MKGGGFLRVRQFAFSLSLSLHQRKKGARTPLDGFVRVCVEKGDLSCVRQTVPHTTKWNFQHDSRKDGRI